MRVRVREMVARTVEGLTTAMGMGMGRQAQVGEANGKQNAGQGQTRVEAMR